MRVIADLHIHGPFSRATSEKMSIEEIARFAKIKGLNVVGTGDFTHPQWFDEIKKSLVSDSDTGLYNAARTSDSSVCFMITTEVSTLFTLGNEVKKIHHVILVPCLDAAAQINDRLSKYGNLTSDGRPTLQMNAASLVEEVMAVSTENMVFPAHAWTPWFSILGAFSGFNSIEECYQDMTKHIHALETGLSSDPPMNWRLTELDRYTLVSNSDSHSFWPWRIGREANVFELERLRYSEIIEAIRLKDKERFRFTIETDPAYGKYHWTGHRNCKVSFSASEAIKFGNICPVCRRKLTKGVEQRVEELADRSVGYKPEMNIDFKRLLPLSEIVASFLNVDSPYLQKVWGIYNRLVEKFGDEYYVLMDASEEALRSVVERKLADAIIRVRKGEVRVTPGYDGVYGKLSLFEEKVEDEHVARKVQQRNLGDFM